MRMNRIASKSKDLYKFFLDLVFPIFCQSCGSEGNWLCTSCGGQIKVPIHRCLSCDRESILGRTHDACRGKNTALAGLLVAAEYHDRAVQNLVWNLKYNSVKSIGETLAVIMTDYLIREDILDYFSGSTIVPVPLHNKRKRRRGFNQAEILGRELAHRTKWQYLDILTRTKNNQRQVDLEKKDRLDNVHGIFQALATPSLGERKIILIDDVATTGATLNECAKELRAQGVGEIWGFVVARN